jgi:hypothetical protein
MKGKVEYRYIGNGASLSGIPARDLTEVEALEYGVKLLLSSRLYVKHSRREHTPDDDILIELEETEVEKWHKE